MVDIGFMKSRMRMDGDRAKCTCGNRKENEIQKKQSTWKTGGKRQEVERKEDGALQSMQPTIAVREILRSRLLKITSYREYLRILSFDTHWRKLQYGTVSVKHGPHSQEPDRLLVEVLQNKLGKYGKIQYNEKQTLALAPETN